PFARSRSCLSTLVRICPFAFACLCLCTPALTCTSPLLIPSCTGPSFVCTQCCCHPCSHWPSACIAPAPITGPCPISLFLAPMHLHWSPLASHPHLVF